MKKRVKPLFFLLCLVCFSGCWLTASESGTPELKEVGGEWVCEIGPAYDDDIECIFLEFREDGGISLRKGLLFNGDAYAFYIGKYTISLAGNNPAGQSTGFLSIALWNEWDMDLSNPDFSSPPELSGKYAFVAEDNHFILYLLEGDSLHYFSDGTPRIEFPFWRPELSDDGAGDGTEPT